MSYIDPLQPRHHPALKKGKPPAGCTPRWVSAAVEWFQNLGAPVKKELKFDAAVKTESRMHVNIEVPEKKWGENSAASRYEWYREHVPPNKVSVHRWHAFIAKILQDPQADLDTIKTGVEALVYLYSYTTINPSAEYQDSIVAFCNKLGEEVAQKVMDHANEKMESSALMEKILAELEERNQPEVDEMSLKEFLKAVDSYRTEVLNATEFKDYWHDFDAKRWKTGEVRPIHLINYTPNQMKRIESILRTLAKDERLNQFINHFNP